MAKGIKICKVCGCEYPYCKTENHGNIFRYQDVACCPEHGKIYFDMIMESRKCDEIETNVKENSEDVILEDEIEDEEEDEEDSEDFEDDAEEL